MKLEIRSKLNKVRERALEELKKSFQEDNTPREIALSFSIGVFITSLPTLGIGFLVFVILVRMFDWISRLALIASAVVLNPFIKPVVWIASINLGSVIMTQNITFTTNPETAITYLIVGNTIIAIIFAIIAYFFAYEAEVKYREKDLEAVEEMEEAIEEDIEKLKKE